MADGEMGLACLRSRVSDLRSLPAVVECAWDGVHAWAGAGNGLHWMRPSSPPLASRLLVTMLLEKLPLRAEANDLSTDPATGLPWPYNFFALPAFLFMILLFVPLKL